MSRLEGFQNRRVLIASSHALFGQGLRSLLLERQDAGIQIVGMVSNLDQAIHALDELTPDLVIIDYDDQALNRDEFLARFVEGEKKLRVVLLSLQSANEAIVYDRRTLAAAQIDDWLKEWSFSTQETQAKNPQPQGKILQGNNRRNNMKHLVFAGILVLLVTALLFLGLENVRLLPVQASVQAQTIDSLFSLEFKVIAFLFSLIVVFMVYSIIFFRRKPGDLSDAAHVEGNTRLEVAWTIAPLITVLIFAYLGGQSLAETLRADPKALEINVVGRQWAWRFEYPQSGVTSDTLILPLNKQAILYLRSEDVIHSFWVPEFRVKQDALPGGESFIRNLRITPSMLGDYKVRCAELCGTQHATMQSPVKVVSQAEFTEWLASQSVEITDPVALGERWVKESGCVACHSLDGSKLVGPTWAGLYGSQAELSDGSLVTVDDAYIQESILEPNKHIVAGYPPNLMPANYSDQLTLDKIQQIIAYLKTLK